MAKKPNIDKDLFKTTLKANDEAPPMQRIVPVSRSGKDEDNSKQPVIYIRVTDEELQQIEIYLAKAGRKVKKQDLGKKAIFEYMENHPVE